MIQLRRGKTASWRAAKKPLAAGQPGYDKDKHKLKIGDGERSWAELPYASGLAAEDILLSEDDAKIRHIFDPEDDTLITYGTEAPDEDTVGQVYLQYYDAAPEVDYVVESGINGIWSYQKWRSGKAQCSGVLQINTDIQEAIEDANLYSDNKAIKSINYPFKFVENSDKAKFISETATIQNPNGSGLVWLACREKNTTTKAGAYTILSINKQTSATKYHISLHVEGFWK